MAPAIRAASMVNGLRAGELWAKAALYDGYASHVERVLRRVLGRELHTELSDLVHDAFEQAYGSAARLRDEDAVAGWLESIAAHTAFRAIRSRRARRWLSFCDPATLPEPLAVEHDPIVDETLRRTQRLLERLPQEQRAVFALRYIHGMELRHVACACASSVTGVKRMLKRAERHFIAAAARDPLLRPWLRDGRRWSA